MGEREWPREFRAVAQSQFQLQSAGLMATSPFTGEATPYGPFAQRFICNVTFPTVRAPTHRYWSGFITSLRGMQNTIRMVDYFRMRPAYDVEVDPGTQNWSDGSTWSDGRGWASGFLPPFCAADEAAIEGENSLVLRGLPASLNAVLRLGDLFEIRPNGLRAAHGMLHELIHESRTDSNGKTRVEFEPSLRKGVAAGDQVVLRYPSSLFRLASDTEGAITRTMGNLGNMGMSLVEVLPQS